MALLVLGSLNIDRTYRVHGFVRPGETISGLSMETFPGGKGLNQAIAAAKAGAKVYLGGAIGTDGEMLRSAAEAEGVDTSHLITLPCPTGHAVIQVDDSGENCILLFGGANKEITPSIIDGIISDFSSGDIVLFQNEISNLNYAINKAHSAGMTVCLNPSPMNESISECELGYVDIFIINRGEGEAMTGCSEPRSICATIHKDYPSASVVLTLGSEGSMYFDGESVISVPAFSVNAVDTTGAGDTFTGYFIAGLMDGMTGKSLIARAAKAAGIAVSRKGASSSIPSKEEVSIF